MSVDSIHPAYSNMISSWNMMADACSSESIIHKRGEAYLPRLSGQSDKKYEAYVRRASFVLFTKRTVEAFAGMVMRKDVHVDGHTSINIDGKGSSINGYVSEVVNEFIKYGRCGTLVDMPVVNERLTIADEIEKNVFSRLLFYKHSDIINWKVSVINNLEVVSLVVLRELRENAQDEFEHDPVYYYRVLDLVETEKGYVYRQRLFNDAYEQEGDDIFPKRNNKHLTFIPFYFHGGINVQYPPLLMIAEQNFHHYRLDADYKHGLHFVALPTPYIIGIPESEKPKALGPSTVWVFEESATECTCGMLEFTGAGLGQIAAAKDDILEIIVTLASRIIAPQKSSNDESALASSIRSNAETSSLYGMVDNLSEDITNAIRVLVWWSNGNANDVEVKINKDFMPSVLTGADVLSYVAAWIKGGVSYSTLFNVLKSGEIIKGNRTILEEIKDISKEQQERMDKEIEKKRLELQETNNDLPDAESKMDNRANVGGD